MSKKFLLSGYIWLSLVSASPVSAADTELLVQRWSQLALENMPQRQLADSLTQQKDSAQRASHAWSGMASLNLGQEKTRGSSDFPVENSEVSLDFPFKVFRQKRVFSQLASAYGQQAQVFPRYLQWQARGIARELLNEIEESQIRALIAHQRVQQARELARLVREQVEAGERSRLDEALAKQRLEQSHAQWLAARQSLLSRWQKAGSWGIPVPEADKTTGLPLLAKSPQKNTPPENPDTKPDWLEKHPLFQWQMAQWQAQVADARRNWWEAGNSPALELGTIREKSFESPEYTLMNVSLSIPLGRSPSARVARAQWLSEKNRLDINRKQLQLELERQRLMGLADWQKAQKLLVPAQARWEAAKVALALTKQAWKQGDSSMRDLLLAQQAALDARLAADLAWQKLAAANRTLKQISGE